MKSPEDARTLLLYLREAKIEAIVPPIEVHVYLVYYRPLTTFLSLKLLFRERSQRSLSP